MSKLEIKIFDWYSPEICRDNPTTLFVFGDNCERFGTGGQACIRLEHNAAGLATKLSPSRRPKDFFEDENDDNRFTILNDITNIYRNRKRKNTASSEIFHTIGFPKDGLGTGLAEMPTRCPKLFQFLCDQLQLCFGYENPNPLKP